MNLEYFIRFENVISWQTSISGDTVIDVKTPIKYIVYNKQNIINPINDEYYLRIGHLITNFKEVI